MKRLLVSIFAAMPLLAADPGWIASSVAESSAILPDAPSESISAEAGSMTRDIIELARLPDLERLDLSHTRISDEGMLNLKPAPKIKELKLFYSEWITDQGMTAIKEWKHLKRLDVPRHPHLRRHDRDREQDAGRSKRWTSLTLKSPTLGSRI